MRDTAVRGCSLLCEMKICYLGSERTQPRPDNDPNMYQKRLLLFAGLLWHSVTFAQSNLPSIEEVADKFYNTYETGSSTAEYRFEKRPGRWTVTVRQWDGLRLVPTGKYLFFDVDSGGYQRLLLPPKADTARVDFRKDIDDFQLANYRIHGYYGYDGWYKDVIATLSVKGPLFDSALNSLARAYSTYANCMVTNQGDDGLKSDLLDLPLASNCMTPAQRERYHQIESKAIETFSRLVRQNPNFETIVGKVPIKYANEVMVEFHTYLTYADSFAVNFSLPDHLYPDDVVAKARQVLEKCPADAILLSLGDNDFYPILYLQQHLHVRSDVRLINRNLIGLDRFIYMAGQPQFQSQPVRLSVTPRAYKGPTNDYLFLKDRSTAMPFSEVVDTLQNGHGDENGALTLPAKEFILRRGMGNDTVHFRETTRYILKTDWILLDLLNNLHGRRLACETLLEDSLVPLNTYFVQVDDNLFVY